MVDQADIYIGVYAWRYGWVPKGSDISITEIEFNRALERQQGGDLKEILVFLIHEDHPTLRRNVEADEVAQEKLRRFKERAAGGRVRKEFRSAEDLRSLVLQSLADFKRRFGDTADRQIVSGASAPGRTASAVERFESATGPIKNELLSTVLLFDGGFMATVVILALNEAIAGTLAFGALCGAFVVGTGSYWGHVHLGRKGYQSTRQEELRLEARKLRVVDFTKVLPQLTQEPR